MYHSLRLHRIRKLRMLSKKIMGVDAKYAYRFVYLKSEEWDSVRLQALVREKAQCQMCGEESISNDAHHIHYPKSFWDTKIDDLVILCRDCHELAHKLLPFSTKKSQPETLADWQSVVKAIHIWQKEKRFPSGKVVIRPAPVAKISECAICARNDVSLSLENILKRYPDAKAVTWKICPDCKLALLNDFAWPLEFKQGNFFSSLRKWAKAKSKTVKATQPT